MEKVVLTNYNMITDSEIQGVDKSLYWELIVHKKLSDC